MTTTEITILCEIWLCEKTGQPQCQTAQGEKCQDLSVIPTIPEHLRDLLCFESLQMGYQVQDLGTFNKMYVSEFLRKIPSWETLHETLRQYSQYLQWKEMDEKFRELLKFLTDSPVQQSVCWLDFEKYDEDDGQSSQGHSSCCSGC